MVPASPLEPVPQAVLALCCSTYAKLYAIWATLADSCWTQQSYVLSPKVGVATQISIFILTYPVSAVMLCVRQSANAVSKKYSRPPGASMLKTPWPAHHRSEMQQQPGLLYDDNNWLTCSTQRQNIDNTLYDCNFSLTAMTSNFCAVWYLTSRTTGFKQV